MFFGARSWKGFFSVILMLLLRILHVLRLLWILFWSPDLQGQKAQQRFCPSYQHSFSNHALLESENPRRHVGERGNIRDLGGDEMASKFKAKLN